MFGTATQSQEIIRIATFHTGLKRAGPGLLLRDILKGDTQTTAVLKVIGIADPDIVLLTRFDFDLGNHALLAFADLLAKSGVDYPYLFALAPNSGVGTGLDLDHDGYTGGARDKQGYGDFAGHGGMAIMSRFPIQVDEVRDFSSMLWRDFPGARLPKWQSDNTQNTEIQRLSSVGHWDVPVLLPDGSLLHLLAFHATTPAFDGPEDRNGLRNHDETMFWLRYLEGALPIKPPTERFVVLGDANLDPVDGEGKHQAIRALLNSGYVQDPEPGSSIATKATFDQGGVNAHHRGDPSLDTADWSDKDGPGNLRVDYVLPSFDQHVLNAGVEWPAIADLDALLKERGSSVSWHGLVWVDIGR
ncbi:MAG: endonuclease/exonuclease/phosphatase family protein [Paracoccaceae bacterium]